jgi:hypothetical protein
VTPQRPTDQTGASLSLPWAYPSPMISLLAISFWDAIPVFLSDDLGSDDRSYRFGSVEEDCRLLLWDFNVGMLHRPKAASPSVYMMMSRSFFF